MWGFLVNRYCKRNEFRGQSLPNIIFVRHKGQNPSFGRIFISKEVLEKCLGDVYNLQPRQSNSVKIKRSGSKGITPVQMLWCTSLIPRLCQTSVALVLKTSPWFVKNKVQTFSFIFSGIQYQLFVSRNHRGAYNTNDRWEYCYYNKASHESQKEGCRGEGSTSKWDRRFRACLHYA